MQCGVNAFSMDAAVGGGGDAGPAAGVVRRDSLI